MEALNGSKRKLNLPFRLGVLFKLLRGHFLGRSERLGLGRNPQGSLDAGRATHEVHQGRRGGQNRLELVQFGLKLRHMLVPLPE